MSDRLAVIGNHLLAGQAGVAGGPVAGSAGSAGDEGDVVVERHGAVLNLVLTRPRQLNVLTIPMIEKLQEVIHSVPDDVALIVMRGSGSKAFCAGGDVRFVRDCVVRNDVRALWELYRNEYRLDAHLHHLGMCALNESCRGPGLMAILDGITMGGGVGLSMGANWRIGTEKLRWAMPETAIGFVPDVGASYFLNRLPRNVGMYLGLTGTTVNAADALACGIITHFVHSSDVDSLLASIEDAGGTGASVTSIVTKHSCEAPRNAVIAPNLADIEACFAEDSVADIMQALHVRNTAFTRRTMETIFERSPTAVVAAFEMLRSGRSMPLEEAFAMELRMATRMSTGHDFLEGVRARLVDRDNKPRWSPSIIADVSLEKVATLFRPFDDPSMELWAK